MATVELDPEAYEALLRLYESDPRGGDVVDGWLDALEADPGQAAVRRRRLGPPDLWYIPFHLSGTADWMILWELQGETVVIRHLGPNVL
jgi:hypothetical protein